MTRRISIILIIVLAGLAASGCAHRQPVLVPEADPAAVRTGFINEYMMVDGRVRPYVVYVPRDYDAARNWPLVVFLHGMGERGDDGLRQTDVGIGHAIRQHPDRFPCLVVMPQCPDDRFWDGAVADIEMAVEKTVEHYSVDNTRITLTGLSMGGFGTWILGAQRTDLFAALMPICGGGHVQDARALSALPVWAFHGADDPVVPVEATREMVEAIDAAGGAVRYTEYPDTGHNAWDRAYAEKKAVRWLLRQRREP